MTCLPARRLPISSDEKTVQFKVSPALKKRIHKMAFEKDETMRAFILRALQQRGVEVSQHDLVDRRKSGAQ